MAPNNNTPEAWNKFWANTAIDKEGDIFALAKEEHSVRWKRIKAALLAEMGTLNGLRVIEIGAGAGSYGALMAKEGAVVTVLDYSDVALNRAHQFFERNELSAEFVKKDALSLTGDLLGVYDVSMSFGLAEHFVSDARLKIFKAHFDVLRKGGMAFISVPNRHNLPYRIFQFVAERGGYWSWGKEDPFSRREFASMCKEIGVTEYGFLGESIWLSLEFVNPFNKRYLRLLGISKHINLDPARIRHERGTWLDQYLSYALVLCGKKW
jgi:2-polyprenyl-3-methyl-5-hydroxy-6-metoxy-1,4-benzoquinol methylase